MMKDSADIHVRVFKQINAFLDNELDEKTADIVRDHIANCDTCTTELDMWIEIRRAVKHAYHPDHAPATLLGSITSRIRSLEQAEQS